MEQWAREWLEGERAKGVKRLEIKTRGSKHYVYCNSFSGNWRYGNSGNWLGDWDGNRISVEKLKNDLQDLMDEINETNQSIQEQIEGSNRRISAAFRAGKITF